MPTQAFRDLQRRRKAREKVAAFEAKAHARVAGPPPDPYFWMSPWRLKATELAEPYKQHPWVYRAATVIADAVVSLPIKVLTGDSDDPKPVTSGDWFRFFTDPCPEATAGDFWTLTTLYQLLPGGETFWLLYGKNGDLIAPGQQPRYAFPYPGQQFKEMVDRRTGMLTFWEFDNGTEKQRIELGQVVHFRKPDPYRPLRGMSPLDAAMRSVRTDHKAHEWNEASLDNGAEPGGILTTEEVISDEQAKQIKQAWEDRHGGARNARKPAVLTGGLKWQQMGLSPKDMEYQSQREWSRQEIAGAYGVPLFLMTVLGDVHRETSREALKLFWENTVKPLTDRMEGSMERDLFRGHEETGTDSTWAAFDYSGVKALQAEATEQADVARKYFEMGVPWNEINERMELEFEEHEGGDMSLVPSGLQPLLLLDEEPPPPPAAPPMTPPPGGGEPAADQPTPPGDEAQSEAPRGSPAPSIRTSKTRDKTRLVLWNQYVKRIQQPGEKRMRSVYTRWMRGIRREVLEYVRTGRAAVGLTQDGIAQFMEEHVARWKQDIREKTRPVDEWIVALSLDRLDEQIGGGLSITPTDPRILEFLDEQGARRVTQTPETIKRHLTAQLIEGVAGGESVGSLQERVRLVMNASHSRSLTIARTESGMASTGARFTGYQAEGVTKHSWVASNDEATRETHAADDGIIVTVGDRFPNTRLLYPLEAGGPAGEVINCRCDTLPED